VARMIMLGCHFMLDVPLADGSKRSLKDAVPFREVYIHALVRDADRQKMSKTKGNVVDPIEIVRRFGTDAVRFTLAAMASPGTDIAFSEERTDGYRAFANKIWNAARFIFMQMDRAAEAGIVIDPAELPREPVASAAAPLETRWIVARLNRTAAEVNRALAEYRFHEAANTIYSYFWGDFCDWYLEIVKLRLDFGDPSAESRPALGTLLSVFESFLRLLSPFMPFITEEIWHAFYGEQPPAKSISLSRFPQGGEHSDDAAEMEMGVLQELIVTLRALRKDLGVEEKLTVPARLSRYQVSAGCIPFVLRLARVSEIIPVDGPLEDANRRSTFNFDVAIVYERKIDLAAERERLTKDLARLEKEAANAERQLGNEGFLAKAPAEVIDGLRRRSGELSTLIPKTRSAIESLNRKSSGVD
jgi:valyl-tRNA synthetase